MSSLMVDNSGLASPGADFPSALSSLIDGAVATFDVDRNTSRRYLLRASALLRAKRPTRVAAEAAPAVVRGGLATWQVNRVIDYIESHLGEKICAQDLADLTNLSLGQLHRSFKVSLGMPPFRYIRNRRIELACSILRTSLEPLSQVALATGMCDESHFCRAFRSITGVSPGLWRRGNGNGNAPTLTSDDQTGNS